MVGTLGVMRQFVLIDQSIRGLTGHHYEYAVHVLGAAEKAGYQPILAANRKFTGQDAKGWPIFREYQFGFWSQPEKRQFDRRPKEFIRRMRFLVRCKLRYSALGLFWLGRTDRAKYLARKPRGLSEFLTRTAGFIADRGGQGSAPPGTAPLAAFLGNCTTVVCGAMGVSAPCRPDAGFPTIRTGCSP